MLVLFYLNSRINGKFSGEFAFVRHLEIVTPIDNDDHVLSFLCLQFAIRDECDYITSVNLQADDYSDVEERYGDIAFSSIRLVHRIVSSNYWVSPFVSWLALPLRRFYVNRFYQNR